MKNLLNRVAIYSCPLLLFVPIHTPRAEEAEQKLPAVVVSAHRYETPAEQVGSAITVITAADIERSGKKDIISILRGVPSLDVIQNGGPGGNTSVFMRGTNSEHTLVILDGIELNNPATNNRAFNFANLSTLAIDRIEILRGPQSLLYGSDALGGVIAIYTKKGTAETNVYGAFEGGSYSTFNESVGITGNESGIDFSIAAGREDTEGISAASKETGNTERDGFENTTFSARIGAAVSELSTINLVSRYYYGKSDIDNMGGPGGDDPNRKLTNEMTAVRLEGVNSLFDGNLKNTTGVSYTNHRTKDNNDPDADHPEDIQRSSFNGSLLKFDTINQLMLSDTFTLQLGAETEEDKADSYFFSDGSFGPFESEFSERSMRTTGIFSELLTELHESLFVTSGIRWDDNSESGSETTYRISPVVRLLDTGTRFTGTIGTGFKAPSLFQLFSSFGNETLDAETSLSWELGVEQSIYDDLFVIGANWFRNEIDNLITFDSQTFIFENIDAAKLQGIEVFVRTALTEQTNLRLDYTYTDTTDLSTSMSLLRRAKNKLGTELASQFLHEKLSTSLRATAYSSRFDNDFSVFPAERTRIGGYVLVDLATEYTIQPGVALTMRIDNIFDTNYEEVLGFGTPGAAIYGGFKVTL